MIQSLASTMKPWVKPPIHRPLHFTGDVKPVEGKGSTAVKGDSSAIAKEAACCDPKPKRRKWAFKALMASLLGGTVLGGYLNLNDKINHGQKQNTVLQAQLGDAKSAFSKAQSRLTEQNDALKALSTRVAGQVSLTDLSRVISQVAPANVMIKGKGGLGSGTWLRDKAGNLFILTNHHVIDENSIRGEDSPPTFNIRLHNGSEDAKPTMVEAQMIKLANGEWADSPEHDLALLGVSSPNFRLPEGVKPLQLRDLKAEPLKVGEFVVVVGTPLGKSDNVTHGIISHVERRIPGSEQANIFIGIDAPINPGNSGGSAYDLQGRYLGPPTIGVRGTDGFGFVIRTDVVQNVLNSWGVQPN